MEITGYYRCYCGAITLVTDTNEEYSCKEENLHRFAPDLDLTKLEQFNDTYSCNHCVNHYGMDLCACGSGEPFETCSNGLDCCGKPMQSMTARYTKVRGKSAIGQPNSGSIDENDLLCKFKVGDKVMLNEETLSESFRNHEIKEDGILGQTLKLSKDDPMRVALFQRQFTVTERQYQNLPNLKSYYMLDIQYLGGFYEEELIAAGEKSVGKSIAAAMEAEKTLKTTAEAEFSELVKKIREAPNSQVTPLGANCFSVPISAIRDKESNPKEIMAAEFFWQESQASLVELAIAHCVKTGNTASAITRLKKMVEEEAVTISNSSFKNRYPLNKITVGIIDQFLNNISEQ